MATDDYFNRMSGNNADGEPIEVIIEATFTELSPGERKEFSSWIVNDNLSVAKVYSVPGVQGKYHSMTKGMPEFEVVRNVEDKKVKLKLYNDIVDSNTLPNLPRAKSAPAVDDNIIAYERTNSEKCTMAIRSQVQFIGPRNIGGGLLDKYTDFVLIPAVRSANDEATDKKGGAIERLVRELVMRQIEGREDLKAVREKIKSLVKENYNVAALPELPSLAKSINLLLNLYSPNSELHLDWDEAKDPIIQFPNVVPALTEHGFKGPIEKKGHGSQRALVISLLQFISTIARDSIKKDAISKPPDLSADAAPEIVEEGIARHLILAIEEPELYLHPNRCRYFSRVIQEITSDPNKNVQVIHATHSPYFVDLSEYSNLRRVSRVKVDGQDICPAQVRKIDNDRVAALWRATWNKSPQDKFDPKLYFGKARPMLGSEVNEALFAKLAFVVEGETEIGLFEAMQEILELKWTEKEIMIVPAGGKTNIDRLVTLFHGIGIMTYFIWDADIHNKDKDGSADSKKRQSETIRCNKTNQQLASATTIVDWPTSSINSNYSVFEDTVESELKKEITLSVYDYVCNTISKFLGYGNLKHANVSYNFIMELYRRGGKSTSLESIVRAITAKMDA